MLYLFVHLCASMCILCVLSFSTVHIWYGLELGPCWCTLMVLKTDTEHTKPSTADCSPIICVLYADGQGFKSCVDIVQHDRKHEQSDKQGSVCRDMQPPSLEESHHFLIWCGKGRNVVVFWTSQPLSANKADVCLSFPPLLVSTTSDGPLESLFKATPLLHNCSNSFRCLSNVMLPDCGCVSRAERPWAFTYVRGTCYG